MTVYELIQHLSKHPANCEVQLVMFTGNDHMEDYLEDSRKSGQEWADIYADILRVRQRWNSTVVTIESQSLPL